jgi:hypothetical protein
MNPNLHLTCVDPWTIYPEYPEAEVFTMHAMRHHRAEAKQVLRPYNCTLVRQFSVEAAKAIPDRSLDFVYIDANHRYEYVVADLAAWSPKVKVGGIVSGHDYKKFKDQMKIHVWEAVEGWTSAYAIRPWFALALRRGDGKIRSFMWVNP